MEKQRMISLRQKIRISKKSLKAFDGAVANAILQLQGKHCTIKSFTYDTYPEGYQLYLAEGDRYTFVYGGKTMSIEMVAEHNFGYKAENFLYGIGASIPMPVGTTILTVYYAGVKGYQLHVTNVSNAAICTAQPPSRIALTS